MSDRLENFVKNNRKEFDEFEPPANLWERIENDLNQNTALPKKERLIKLSVLLKIAALLLVIITTGILFVDYQKKESANISNINPVLADVQVQYASMIEARRSELKKIENENPHLYSEFAGEIKKMDTSYQHLKNDLPSSPNQEETVKAMILNLQAQLEVLNQQLTIIQQIKHVKKPKNETQTI